MKRRWLVVLALFAGCADRQARVVKKFPTTPPAIVWEVPNPLVCGELLEGPVRAFPSRVSAWTSCVSRPRTSCFVVTFDERIAPVDCSGVGTTPALAGGRWSAVDLGGSARFFEERSAGVLVVDATSSGVRSLEVHRADGGLPMEPMPELVASTFWSMNEWEQLAAFADLSGELRLQVMKTKTPALEPLFDELFGELPPEQQRALVSWQVDQALPVDGGVSESSILLALLDDPAWWPTEFPRRVVQAWRAGVARPVLVTHAAWFGEPEAEKELCRALGRRLYGARDTQEAVDPLTLAVIAERRIQCEWVGEAARQQLEALMDCDECSLEQSKARARALIDEQLRPPSDESVEVPWAQETSSTPLLAALAVQKSVPWDVAIRLARRSAVFLGDEGCFDRRQVVGLPPEVRHFVDDWGCDFAIDDERKSVSVVKRLK